MRKLAALVFPEFQTLDLFGPLEFFGWLPNDYQITIVGENTGHVISRSGQRLLIDRTFDDADDFDLILVPGGPGTPVEKENSVINCWLKDVAEGAEIVMGVCTGSALLARTGLLDGRNATTNKMDFEWALPYGPNVNWIGKARWVEDGKYFTSSGVSAGMDLSLAVISKTLGKETALQVARWSEYSWHEDASSDPFAVEHGI
jgi:transcriptional regulator GlxA family with amidase domain